MFSGSSNAHTSPPQHASQGFAGFAPQANGFSVAASNPPFNFSSATTTSLFGPSSNGGSGFRFTAGSSSAPVGPPRTSGFTLSASTGGGDGVARPLFGPPRVAPFGPSTGGGGFSFSSGTASAADSGPRINPLGRGLTTRECFAVNDDQRFVNPAFQSTSKSSAWATIVSLSRSDKSTKSEVPALPAFRCTTLFGSSPAAVGFGGATTTASFGATSNAATTTMWGGSGLTTPSPPTAIDSSLPKPLSWIGGTSNIGASTGSSFSGGSIGFGVAQPAAPPVGGGAAGFQGGTTLAKPHTQTPHVNTGNTFARFGEPFITGAGKAASPFVGFHGGTTVVKPQTQTPHEHAGNPFARFGETLTTDANKAALSCFGPAEVTTATALPVNPFSVNRSSLSSDVAVTPSPWTFGRPKEPCPPTNVMFGNDKAVAPTGGEFRFGLNEASSTQSTTPAFSFPKPTGGHVQHSPTPQFSLSSPTPSLQPNEVPVTDTSSLSDVGEDAASASEQGNEVVSLALPPLTPSYSTITGSRATAFLRRAGVGRSKGFAAQSHRVVAATTPSPRKFSKEFPSTPASKSIERVVVGGRGDELWKRSASPLKTSLLAKSAHVAAAAFSATVPKADEMTPTQDDEAKSEEHADVPTTAPEGSVNLDDYDL